MSSVIPEPTQPELNWDDFREVQLVLSEVYRHTYGWPRHNRTEDETINGDELLEEAFNEIIGLLGLTEKWKAESDV
jgi:hypothetical protein